MGSAAVIPGDFGLAGEALGRKPAGPAIVDWPADIFLKIGPGTDDSAAGEVFFPASEPLRIFPGVGTGER